ncbi:hypothetical protein BDZ94DRAFT_1210295 [Collybia nuda]|uniref:CUE domain-containing protein n=1 Tax=Collybia nuda TaxID=64659 RepID=A0A9P5YFD6_9AGAR|nr:hypothetical protein BDZ94DRAFT_1210295 [Collybia nuda]
MSTLQRLPSYPSTQTRKSLSPSQLATLTQTISLTLQQTLTLPASKRDPTSTHTFLTSYAKDTAVQTLQALIWGAPTVSHSEQIIRRRVLLLASSTPNLSLDIQTLLDLAIVYAPSSITHLRTVFSTASTATPSLTQTIETDLVPAFTQLLSPAQGLYAVRKAAHCVSAFLHAAPPALVRPFAHSIPFALALAALYGPGLASIAQSYGGPPRIDAVPAPNPDEWEHIWVATKAALIDAFHALLRTLLLDLSDATGRALAAESERTFGLVFALLDAQPAAASTGTTPFLDRPLLADYNTTYPLAQTLAQALRHAGEKDARLDILEAALVSPNANKNKDPGALRLLLHSSGVPPGIDGRSQSSRPYAPTPQSTITNQNQNQNQKGKGKAPDPGPTPRDDPDLDIKVTQILDVLPDLSPAYLRLLLAYSPLGGDPERVLGALLEGSAPPEGAPELQHQAARGDPTGDWDGGAGEIEQDEASEYISRRANVFDGAAMDLSRVHVGKKGGDGEGMLRDRAEVEAMKADILRRAEAAWADDDEDDEDDLGGLGGEGKGKAKVRVVAFEDEEDVEGGVRVVGDGEESGSGSDDDEGDDGDGDGDGEQEEKLTPETILELAYIRDPSVFNRDAATARGAAREDLRKRTGWDNGQIEGWRVMLERDPKKKEKMLQKHEFSGNRNHDRPTLPSSTSTSNNTGEPGGSGRGRGRGGRGRGGGGGGRGGGGGGRGGGRGGGAGGGEGGGARERAWKDKNKASRANHNRKRGHDKKMSRAGAGVPPS